MRFFVKASKTVLACIISGCVFLPTMGVTVVDHKTGNCKVLVSMAESGILLFNIRTDRLDHNAAFLNVEKSYALDSKGRKWNLIGRRQPFHSNEASIYFPLQIKLEADLGKGWDDGVKFSAGSYLVQIWLREKGENFCYKATLRLHPALAVHPVIY